MCREGVFWLRLIAITFSGVVKKNIQFGCLEAGRLDLKIDIQEGLHFGSNKLRLASGVLRELVVAGDDLRSSLDLLELG